MTNIFNLPLSLPDEELFESIVSTNKVLIERIISTGHAFPSKNRRRDAGSVPHPVGLRVTAFRGQTTPPGEWYDGAYKLPNSIRETAPYQDKDE